jgi:predicted MFS family arabinose efflux permease
MTLSRGVVAMCAAQACAQIGAFSVPAVLPNLISVWALTNTEAGWISGIYYAAYTLTVPLLSSLTDRLDPKRIYLGSVAVTALAFAGFAWIASGFWSALAFRALMGAGWAGSYMPGLKALSDLAEGQHQSRAVAAHAAAVGVSGALSFGVAGAVSTWLGWQWALVPGALGATLAFMFILIGLPSRPVSAAPGPRRALLDFRPVLRNRSAVAYSIAYCVHTWEMSALRAWVVTFLTYVAAQTTDAWKPLAPATVASVMGLIGVWASVWGNELAIRFGRRRFILGTMVASAALAAVIGFSAALPYAGAAALVLLYAMLIWSDSSSLTAGSAGSAEPGQRGATLAVHSTLGYAGGFLGPLVLGATLDLFGGASVLGWGLAFGHVTIALLLGALVFAWLRPTDLAGDRSVTAATGTAPLHRSWGTRGIRVARRPPRLHPGITQEVAPNESERGPKATK